MIQNIWTPKKRCNYPKIWLVSSVIVSKRGRQNGKQHRPRSDYSDSDLGLSAVWSGSTLFAQTCLYENLGTLLYLPSVDSSWSSICANWMHLFPFIEVSGLFNFKVTWAKDSSLQGEGWYTVFTSIRSSISVRRPHSLNIFSSETTGPIKAKFHMASPCDGGMKVCSNGPGQMTKLATMPIYGKNLKKSSPEPKDWWPSNLICSIRYSCTTKFVEMMTLGWPWHILQQGQIWSLMLLYEKKVKQWIFQKLLLSVIWN